MSSETVTVVGLGYVGLTLSLALASKGFNVYGFDISKEKIKSINSGNYYNAETTLRGDVKATNDPKECIPRSDYIIICVPTPLKEDKTPDLSYIENAANTISENFKEGATIILESTTYPGTTEELLKPIFEKTGKKFYLGYSPERISPGDKSYPIEKIPKVISGINEESLSKIEYLYSKIIKHIVKVSDTKTAEAVKIYENVFRAVNISLVNELAMIFEKMGINMYEVIEAAKTKPMGFMPFYPGPGIGGHCIAIDPFYLLWKAKTLGIESKFIEVAGDINYKITQNVLEKIKENLNKDSKILILGVTYKKDVPDTRNSPAEFIIKNLNYKVDFYDPYIKNFNNIQGLIKPNIEDYDIIVLLTDHDKFKELDFSKFKGVMIDTRNFFKEFKEKPPFNYIGLGKGKIEYYKN